MRAGTVAAGADRQQAAFPPQQADSERGVWCIEGFTVRYGELWMVSQMRFGLKTLVGTKHALDIFFREFQGLG